MESKPTRFNSEAFITSVKGKYTLYDVSCSYNNINNDNI